MKILTNTASVAKRLRQRIVVPPFAGSIPVVRPESYYSNDRGYYHMV